MNNNPRLHLPGKFVLVLLFFLIGWKHSIAQSQNGSVQGTVLDGAASAPIGFASVAIYNSGEKNLVDGNVTDDQGKFEIELPFGSYYAIIEFMGFDSVQTPVFEINRDNRRHNLGNIQITSYTADLD